MLSGMAKGIQPQHSTVNLFKKYVPNPSNNEEVTVIEPVDPCDMLWDWALNHETIVSLNGGITPELMDMIEFLEYDNCPYPWAYFREDESLGELVTSISLVLPERIYDTASLIRTKTVRLDGNVIKPLNWDYYNENFIMYKYIELENTCLRYGEFSEFEINLINRMNTYRLATTI